MIKKILQSPIALLLIGLSFFAGWLVFITILDSLGSTAAIDRIVEEINHDYRGVITRKYSTRKNIEPTFLTIRDQKNLFWEISPNYEVVLNANIGDSITKVAGQNLVTLKKASGEKLEFYYTRISDIQREHSKFPKEWKDKWPEASAESPFYLN